MAERTDEQTEDTPELAPNMWFTEYGMPYTTAILEGEAESNRANPELRGEERHPMAQFLIDQETAVARDYLDGNITEAEFQAFKEMSAQQLEDLRDRAEVEIEELEEDMGDWAEDLEIEAQAFGEEHGTELLEIVDAAKVRELAADDLSLHMTSDLLALGVNALDDGMERLPPHIHDLVNLIESGTVDSAHVLLDARAELSSADDHNLEGERERLENIEPAFEADMAEAHESIDAAFERIDKEIAEVQEFVGTAQEHAERDPATTAEHFPFKTPDDHELPTQIEEETGITDA